MDQYYTDEMKRCTEAIEADGLEATVEIDATDLMILLSKAVMQRVPILVQKMTPTPSHILRTGTGSGVAYDPTRTQTVDSNGVAYAPRAPILPKEKPQGSTGATRRD